jgi:hypothetical protein
MVLTLIIPFLVPHFSGRINKVALHYYMDFFDFTALRLDLAFRSVPINPLFISPLLIYGLYFYHYRRLCAKLYLKGETQQVDRILEQFSRRYWENNPGGVYGSSSELSFFHSTFTTFRWFGSLKHVTSIQLCALFISITSRLFLGPCILCSAS